MTVGIAHDPAEWAIDTIRRWGPPWAGALLRMPNSGGARRWGQRERAAYPPVEEGTPEAGRCYRAPDVWGALSAGDERVEQA